MNVFRSRKKSITEADGRPSLEKAPPVPTLRGRTIFRKKTAPEPKPELDIKLALPTHDDFRTSLLLPNLSARFSMLRELDDPTTKIGKAADDSVLFPKRSSRLDLFGLGAAGLTDIAEDPGIPPRPFAYERHHSDPVEFADSDDDPEHQSMMSRAKPGQGSNLFGGRQKVLVINGGGRPTKAVYNDDVSYSVFQELKRKEREARKEAEEAGDYFDDGDRSSNEQDRQKRETNSSTNSNPAEGRSSTAATSIASQFGAKASPVGTPGERPGQKKRLYGQGLDQQLQDQQSAATSRLNSLQRGFQRNGSMTTSRSATNLNNQFRSSSPFSPVLRSGSPSPIIPSGAFSGFDFSSARHRSTSRDAEALGRGTPPMSPVSVGSPVDPMLAASLDANDLGKATASGAFNKPRGPYNEQQFAQRQLQLQEGRNTPPLRSMSRAESASEQSARLRNGSFASGRSGQDSRQQYRRGSEASHAPSEASNPPLHHAGAFLADQSGSEYGSGPNSPEPPPTMQAMHESPEPARRAPHVPPSPAFQRASPEAARPKTAEDRRRPAAITVQPREVKSFLDPTAPTPIGSPDALLQNPPASAPANVEDPSSKPTHLGSGLNDLIRGHFRQDSGASSIYPVSPGFAPDEYREPTSAPEPEHDPAAPTAQESMQMRAKQILERANQLASASSKAHDVLGVQQDKAQQILGGEAPRRSSESSRQYHTRGASTETQKEREEFASELAERRKQVQDNLKRMEAEAQSPSESSPAKHGFGLLKKASRGSLAGDNSKASKVLGMGGQAPASNEHGSVQPRRARAPSNSSQARPGAGPAPRERNIGTERRERFLRKGQHPAAQNFERPGMAGPAPLPPGQYGYGRPQNQPAEQNSYYPAGRARKYSPPGTKPVAPPGPLPPGQRGRPSPDRVRPKPASPAGAPNGSYFPPPEQFSPSRQGTGHPGQRQPSNPNHQAFSTNTTPPIESPPPPFTTNPAVAAQNVQNRSRKKSFSKYDISEPMFVSGTSSVSTVNLPNGASLQNGMVLDAPPLPAMNPNRRRGGRIMTTQNIFTAFGGPAMNESRSVPGSAHNNGEFDEAVFSGEDLSPRMNPRMRVRAGTSEGGTTAAKARHHALLREAETLPNGDGAVNGVGGGRSGRKHSESQARAL